MLYKVKISLLSLLRRPQTESGNIAHKIAKFIQEPEKLQENKMAQTEQLSSSFKEVCNSNRWTTEALRKAQIQIQDESIRIIGGTSASEKDLLSRCIVGKFQNSLQDTPCQMSGVDNVQGSRRHGY